MAQRKAVNWGSFDAQHFLNSQKYDFFIKRLYDKALEDIAKDTRKRGRGTLSLAKDRQFRKELDDTIEALTGDVYHIINKASEEEWELSNKKNDAFIHSIMDTSKLAEGTLRTYMDRNLQGLQAFQSRKVDGLGLSDRLWQYNKSFKNQIELGLEVGIGEGASALRMAKQLKENLNEPDKLFRRVRDKGGNLQLSKAAKLYNPGRGIYRSSHKNAMRLARTEINMAYRTADWERWQKLDFVSGFEVKRSNREPVCKCEVCEQLQGRYPKEFKFLGWHPQCLCFAIPILQEMKELRERRRSRFKNALHGKPQIPPAKPANAITSVPQGFVDWAQDNAARSTNWASTPYFIRDNFVGGAIGGGLLKRIGITKPIVQINEQVNKVIGEGTQSIVYNVDSNTVEKVYKSKVKNVSSLLNDYKVLLKAPKSDMFVDVVEVKKNSVIMEKLDTKSTKLDLFDASKDLFKVGLDELSILEEGTIKSKYMVERLLKMPYDKRSRAIKYAKFVIKLDNEGRRLGLNIDDIHKGNFGVDDKGNIKMFDFRK